MFNEEKDISDFADKGDLLSELKHQHNMLPITSMMKDVSQRSSIYLEFMAAAFLKETGLKASEVDLVIHYGVDSIHFSFEKKNK